MAAVRMLTILTTVLALWICTAGLAEASRRQMVAIQPSNTQHVQFTVALFNTSCSMLPKAQDQSFADRFRASVRQDVVKYLTGENQKDAAASIKAVADSCFDSMVRNSLTIKVQPF